MIFAGVFEVPASLLAWLYSVTHSYSLAISLIAVLVMMLVFPLTLKSTKGMLEMQKLAPEMRRLQNEHRGDRQKLNEEMMKLYQEHKVNPMASCLPLVAQAPVFIVMFRILTGMTYRPSGGNAVIARSIMNASGVDAGQPVGFMPRYLSHDSELYRSLVRQDEMNSFGLDLSVSPAEMLGESFGRGLIYAAIVVLLGALYYFQQRMVAARAAVNPTMSAGQQKLMQYLPVVFAVFQIFFLLGLVVYYIVQAILRIIQQYYITRRFYHGEESLGRQAQAASARVRELTQSDGGGGGMFAQAKRDMAQARGDAGDARQGKQNKQGKQGAASKPSPASKRTTAPKSRPTPSANQPSGRPGRRPASAKKRRRP